MKNRAVFSDLRGVIVTSGIISNSLGVVRAFGRRGIPVIYIGARQDRVSYSRYVKRLLLSPRSVDSEKEFINTLLDFGKEIAGRIMIIPTGDSDVLALSKHKLELEEYY